MWAIIRRKVVSGGSSASVFGRLLRETRPVMAPASRGYTTKVKERLLLGRGSKIVGNVGLHSCLGCPVSSKTVRSATYSLVAAPATFCGEI